MILGNLRILHQHMKRDGQSRAVFPFQFHKKGFSCMFLTDVDPYRLYLATLGRDPFSFEFDISSVSYNIQPWISSEEYRLLCRYLELKYDPNKKFEPSVFLSELNRNLPQRANTPCYSDVLKVARDHRQIEDSLKVYFCGLRSNPSGAHMTDLNYEKTRMAFGDQIANTLRRENTSTRWTDNSNEEDLMELNRRFNVRY